MRRLLGPGFSISSLRSQFQGLKSGLDEKLPHLVLFLYPDLKHSVVLARFEPSRYIEILVTQTADLPQQVHCLQ